MLPEWNKEGCCRTLAIENKITISSFPEELWRFTPAEDLALTIGLKDWIEASSSSQSVLPGPCEFILFILT